MHRRSRPRERKKGARIRRQRAAADGQAVRRRPRRAEAASSASGVLLAMLCAMRSNQIFSSMTTEQTTVFLDELKQGARPVAALALSAAAQAFKLRPEFLKRQPTARQAEWVRKALGRTAGAPIAEEVLASYFLDHHKPLLIELLDTFGVEHDEGQLKESLPACPPEPRLREAVETFRKGEQSERRELLLRAFAAQSGIDWPDLERLL